MTDWKVPLYKIYSDDEDVNLITKIIKRGERWAIGPEIEEFENAIKTYVDVDYCVSLNSGTSALHATLLAYNLGKQNEIIVPSFSIISTVNSVLFVNSTPVFADIEESTFGLDPTKIQSKITSQTKALMPMDYGGLSCQINEIKSIAKENNLILIEDAAEGLGSSINNNKVGSVSDSSIFSFCGNKVLTTGEGGAVVTNSKEIFEKIKLIRSHGRQDKRDYFSNPNNSDYVGLGYNWRMSSLTAALGISQISKLDKLIKMRKNVANYFSDKLKKFPQIITPIVPDGYDHIYQMYTVRLPNKKIRDNLHQFLMDKKIFSKVYFYPIHQNDYYKSNFPVKDNSLLITEKISQQILTLPIYPNMSNEEKDLVVESISEFFESDESK
jgi:perosamine synthetase